MKKIQHILFAHESIVLSEFVTPVHFYMSKTPLIKLKVKSRIRGEIPERKQRVKISFTDMESFQMKINAKTSGEELSKISATTPPPIPVNLQTEKYQWLINT